MTMLKVGICGYGGLGHVHAASLIELAGVEVVAVCDKRPEQLAATAVTTNLGTSGAALDLAACRTYTDFNTMLRREKLDALVTALPTDLHAKFAIQAMNRGIHVFSEKPMALTSRQCAAMIAARDRNHVQLQIGQCLRFWPEYQALRQAIQEQPYGKLQALTMTRVGGYAGWSAENWFNDHRRSGGAILDLHLHDVDWAQHALGMPLRLTASGTVGQTGATDDVTALWEYADCTVTLRGSWKAQAFAMSFQAFFETATLEYGLHPDPALRLRRANAATDERVPVRAESAYVAELRYFFDCVRGRQQNTLCTAESTAESVRLVELERRAIREHRWLTLFAGTQCPQRRA